MQQGFITDKIKEEIKSRADIVDVISEYIPLTQKGKAFVGLCPFHDDTNPSLSVRRDMGQFRCFSCNAGGDVFTFIMKYQNLTYPEAIKSLAEKYGIKIAELTQGDGTAQKVKDELKNLNQFAVEYFHKILVGSTSGSSALTYLKNRGIEDNTIANFKLGFSLPSWDGLFKSATKAGFSTKTLLQGGFILEGKSKDHYYDRFRGRVMFPIFDPKGEPIAFGGRILEAEKNTAKYINSPETPLYSKSKTLYNLNLAQRSIQNEGFAILVEGYMDAISCYQAGVNNVIASLGTALTDNHVKLLRRWTSDVVIAYDTDKAGENATLRGLDLLVKDDIKVRVLTIPSGKDPDDYIRENGTSAFRKLVDDSDNLVEYKINRIEKYIGINNVDGKKQAVNNLVGTLASMKNQVERSEYVKKCAERLNVEEEFIWQELAKHGAGKNLVRSTQPSLKSKPKKSAKENIEKQLIECLIQYPEFIRQSRSQLTKDDFSNDYHIELIELLWGSFDNNKGVIELGDLINMCKNKESRDFVSSLILKKSPLPDGEALYNGCIKKMMEFREREYRKTILKESAEDKLTIAKRLMDIRKGNSY
jgi:DNA primase